MEVYQFFKLYTSFNIKEYNVGSALTIVIKKEHIEIIKYMFETEFRQKFQITNNSAYKLLKVSLFSTKTDIFSYLLKHLIDVEHIIPDFYNQNITWLLSHSCSIGNIEMSKILCELDIACTKAIMILADF